MYVNMKILQNSSTKHTKLDEYDFLLKVTDLVGDVVLLHMVLQQVVLDEHQAALLARVVLLLRVLKKSI